MLKSLLAILRQWSLKKNCKPRSHVRILICQTGAIFDLACPHNPSLPALYPVARDHCGTFELISKESGGKALFHHPSLALLACLGCSRVPQSPLSLGKACGEGSLTRLSLRLLAFHFSLLLSTPLLKCMPPAAWEGKGLITCASQWYRDKRQFLALFFNDCFVTPPMTAFVTNVQVFPRQVELILRIPFPILISCCLLKYSRVLNW